ncbi:DUF1491 family protein [Mesorhizobium sp. J428]|uniref:DUF1491 family protein n=1 Tax=Mesorhizobium sp. J428 TaxID=2898440 RepID=UPI0021519FB7|nr:DUF1491 family protein [Mesorhizobium sp. J428]MCR5858892.1 DUF1491 family protein [Mesorhizobium sp. J428]
MRVTSDLWVSALLRRAFGEGGFGAVLRRGGDSAGAIFIVTRDRMGEATLYGPAPQTGYDDARPDDRLFVELMRTTDGARIDERLAKESRFDPDLWLVEIEPGRPDADLFPLMKP